MDINALGNISYQNAVSHGFYEQIEELMNHPNLTVAQKSFIRVLWRSNRLMLIVSELGEALEGLRKDNMSNEPQSGGFGEELADAQIRLADLAIDVGLDLDAAVQWKVAYNVTRPHRHGGRQV